MDKKFVINIFFTKDNAASFSEMTYSVKSVPLVVKVSEINGSALNTPIDGFKLDVTVDFKFTDKTKACIGKVSLIKFAEQIPVSVECK